MENQPNTVTSTDWEVVDNDSPREAVGFLKIIKARPWYKNKRILKAFPAHGYVSIDTWDQTVKGLYNRAPINKEVHSNCSNGVGDRAVHRGCHQKPTVE